MDFPALLHVPAASHPSVNVNGQILDFYVRHIVPGITKDKDDGNYGSSATRDVEVLQALSRRIHFGELLQAFLKHAHTQACSSPSPNSNPRHQTLSHTSSLARRTRTPWLR